jgi:hypothetical protein
MTQQFESMGREDLTRYARDGKHLAAFVTFCKFNGQKEIAMIAIKNPNIDPEALLEFLAVGRAAMMGMNAYRTFEGDWWQFTEGIKNPALFFMIQDERYKRRLDGICGCDVREYLYGVGVRCESATL